MDCHHSARIVQALQYNSTRSCSRVPLYPAPSPGHCPQLLYVLVFMLFFQAVRALSPLCCQVYRFVWFSLDPAQITVSFKERLHDSHVVVESASSLPCDTLFLSSSSQDVVIYVFTLSHPLLGMGLNHFCSQSIKNYIQYVVSTCEWKMATISEL